MIIYFFNRVNNTIFPLSWKKWLLDAVVVAGRQGLTDCMRNKLAFAEGIFPRNLFTVLHIALLPLTMR